MKVGVVDIGTNSMRMLITSEIEEVGRWAEVTGLGRGVDRTGVLGEDAIAATVSVLSRFGKVMDDEGVARRKAIATSAARDAANREQFFDRAGAALGVRPTLITGEQEARYAFAGATAVGTDPSETVVSDIGGGSTEFVSREQSVSVDIGSVRLTERSLPDRPASADDLEMATTHVRRLFAGVDFGKPHRVIGIAGTWTSLAAIGLDLPEYDREQVHGHLLSVERLDELVSELGRMTLEQTRAIPSLDPNRAPVILSGAVIAREVLRCLEADDALASENDTLDGVAAELLALG